MKTTSNNDIIQKFNIIALNRAINDYEPIFSTLNTLKQTINFVDNDMIDWLTKQVNEYPLLKPDTKYAVSAKLYYNDIDHHFYQILYIKGFSKYLYKTNVPRDYYELFDDESVQKLYNFYTQVQGILPSREFVEGPRCKEILASTNKNFAKLVKEFDFE